MPWTPLCPLADLREGEGKFIRFEPYDLAVFLHGGQPYVLSNRCPHAGAPLSAGWIEQDCVICPRHCWPFRLTDGQLRDTPGVGVDTYTTRIVDGTLEADLPERADGAAGAMVTPPPRPT